MTGFEWLLLRCARWLWPALAVAWALGLLWGLGSQHFAGAGWLLPLVLSALATHALARWADAVRERFIRESALPQALKRKLRETFPHLGARDAELAERALRQFFIATLRSRGQYTAVPTRAADVMWEVFAHHAQACAALGTGPAATNRSTRATPAVCRCCLPSTPSSTFRTACATPHAHPVGRCRPPCWPATMAPALQRAATVAAPWISAGWSHAASTACGSTTAIPAACPGVTAAMAAAMRTGRAPAMVVAMAAGAATDAAYRTRYAFHSCLRPRKGRCSPISCKNPGAI